jgi:hypothetical protein
VPLINLLPKGKASQQHKKLKKCHSRYRKNSPKQNHGFDKFHSGLPKVISKDYGG